MSAIIDRLHSVVNKEEGVLLEKLRRIWKDLKAIRTIWKKDVTQDIHMKPDGALINRKKNTNSKPNQQTNKKQLGQLSYIGFIMKPIKTSKNLCEKWEMRKKKNENKLQDIIWRS